MPQITMKSTSQLKPDPNQPRKVFDDAELDRLGDDLLARGVLVHLLVLPCGTIIDGERRWRAAQRKGIKELPVSVIDKSVAEAELQGIQLATVFHKVDLTPHEKWQALVRLKELHPAWSMKEFAEFLHIEPSTLTKLQSPSKCVAEVQDALRNGKIGMSDCYEISRAPAEQQGELLRLKLAGMSRDGLAEQARKQRTVAGPQVRIKRIACPLPSGLCISVSGKEFSLEDLIEALGEAQKEAKKAREQKLDVKTWQCVMRDRSRAV